MSSNLFEFVKDSVKLSDFVNTLPNVKGLHSVGSDRYRCNNVISDGDNVNAMIIDDESKSFKVFSHGQEHGDVITLYGLVIGSSDASPRDSAIGLAQYMGVSIPEGMLKKSGSGDSKGRLISVMDNIAEKAQNYLLSSSDDDAIIARKYLHDRGMSRDMIEFWRLGLLPEDPIECRSLVSSCGNENELKKCGIYGGKKGDFISMMGRLMIPIMNMNGKCISFSARLIPGVESHLEDSKYINTSSTDIYDKSSTLYGQHLIKEFKPSNVIFCEGNFDAMALNEICDDDTVAVATCGTALTESHIDLVRKNRIKSIQLMFDSDQAGKDAVASLVWISNYYNNATVLSVPDNIQDKIKDPWDMFEESIKVNECNKSPLIIRACSIVGSSRSRQDSLTWYKDSFKKLNYLDDRAILTSEMMRVLNVNRRVLNDVVSDLPKISNKNVSQESSDDISPEVKSLIAALLSMDLPTREKVAFPILLKKTSDSSMEICGAKRDYDKQAILSSLGIRRDNDRDVSSRVFSLTPGEELEEASRRDSAQRIALSIIREWKLNGIPKNMKPYIGAVSSISSGSSTADGIEQMTFLFDLISIHN